MNLRSSHFLNSGHILQTRIHIKFFSAGYPERPVGYQHTSTPELSQLGAHGTKEEFEGS
jgi:hypothetical protein